MVDLSAITGVASSLNALVNITKAMKDVHDANLIQTKVFELTREIMSAQQGALAAQMAQSALLQRERDLEAEISKLKTWETEKNRYQMRDYGGGTIAYELKSDMANSEPIHRICPACYNNGKKGLLHPLGPNAYRQEQMKCAECDKTFFLGMRVERNLSATRARGTDFDVFRGE